MWCVIFGAVPVRPTPGLLGRLGRPEIVLAADSGARSAFACGFVPRAVVGDLDSIDGETLAEVTRQRIPVERHPVDKDASDTELALHRAVELGATVVTVVGALGGERLDHALANVMLLSAAVATGRAVTLLDNRAEVGLLQGPAALHWRGAPGEFVTLLPLGAAVDGVHTTGLRWPLHGDLLHLGATRGLSNEVVQPDVSVRLESGRLLWIRALGDTLPDWPLDTTSASKAGSVPPLR